MNNPNLPASLPKIYSTTALIAFAYAGLTLVFLVYKQFFYIEGNWLHGFIANSLAVISSLIWAGILFVFKRFLNKEIHYNKADSLINTYLIFMGIIIFSLGTMVVNAIKLYLSLGSENLDSMMAFASNSFSSAIWFILSNVGILVVSVLLGNRIRQINGVLKDLFTILGFSFVLFGICSALQMIHYIEGEAIPFLLTAFTAAALGYVFEKASKLNYSDLTSSLKLEATSWNEPQEKTEVKISSYSESEKTKEKSVEVKTKEIHLEPEAIPNINPDELENKELVLSYFENLPKEEVNRLEIVVSKKYTQQLTEEQKTNLVIHYIAEKKLYDHQRFAPK